MRVWTDLHIHSCLSPCAENDMTPWNLVGMARVKGLEVIALTDHNAALNLPQALAAGEAYGVSVIPGMEITAREEVHLLAYFDTLADALACGAIIDAHLPDVANNAALFGEQLVIGEDDARAGEAEKLLISATDLSVDDVAALVTEHNGLCVPAHINRSAYGLLGVLGMMPPLPAFPVVEVAQGIPCPESAVAGRLRLRSSDAHRLADILEPVFSLEADEASARGVLMALRRGLESA